jgi:hypothetical protein
MAGCVDGEEEEKKGAKVWEFLGAYFPATVIKPRSISSLLLPPIFKEY